MQRLKRPLSRMPGPDNFIAAEHHRQLLRLHECIWPVQRHVEEEAQPRDTWLMCDHDQPKPGQVKPVGANLLDT